MVVEIPTRFIHGQGSASAKRESKKLRLKMIEESLNWDCYTISEVNDWEDDLQKKWTPSGRPVLGYQLWFGKPGKDWNKDGITQDMRVYFISNRIHPSNLSSIDRQQRTFGELVEFLSLIHI